MKLSYALDHHAHLLTGDRQASHRRLLLFLRTKWGVEESGNPDFHAYFLESFGLEDARALLDIMVRRVFGGTPRIIILSFHAATAEAQNALLKILEEPAEGTMFFILTSAPSSLLPTVRSRLTPLILPADGEAETELKGEEFIRFSVSERLKFIENINQKDNQEKKSDLFGLLNSIESACGFLFKEEIPREWRKPLEELLILKRYLFDRAPSVKMIGEYLALRFPRIEGGK